MSEKRGTPFATPRRHEPNGACARKTLRRGLSRGDRADDGQDPRPNARRTIGIGRSGLSGSGAIAARASVALGQSDSENLGKVLTQLFEVKEAP